MSTRLYELRRDHQRLRPHVHELRVAADWVGVAPVGALAAAVRSCTLFLTDHLVEHLAAEERILYPAFEAAVGSVDASLTMRHDHRQVRRLTTELVRLEKRLAHSEPTGTLPEDLARDLRRVLYGLFAVLELHQAKETDEYLAVLEDVLDDAGDEDLTRRFRTVDGTEQARRGRISSRARRSRLR